MWNCVENKASFLMPFYLKYDGGKSHVQKYFEKLDASAFVFVHRRYDRSHPAHEEATETSCTKGDHWRCHVPWLELLLETHRKSAAEKGLKTILKWVTSPPPDQPLAFLSLSQQKTRTGDRGSKGERSPRIHWAVLRRRSRCCRSKQKWHCDFLFFFIPSNICSNKKACDFHPTRSLARYLLSNPQQLRDSPWHWCLLFWAVFWSSAAQWLEPHPETAHVRAMLTGASWRLVPRD